MALLFTGLLSVGVGSLAYIWYAFAQGHAIAPGTIKWLLGIAIAVMVIVIGVSFLISTFVVTRTGRIAATARTIMVTGDLTRRIPLDSRWDDLGYMAQTLNQLLARIEDLMQGIKRVSDNIAHDLRTPLTRLRNRLETLQKDAGADVNDDTKALYDGLVQEADHLLATFAALLRIAYIETGRQKSQFADVHLDRVLLDVLDLYEPLAEEKQIKISHDLDAAACRGDRDLLFQAFANLLDNAIKFTPVGGTIAVKLKGDVFTLSDTGPGVPDADQARIFDRFYRSEQSRNTPGNGLGLSLVAAVADVHDARIETRNANPGFEVRILF